MAFSTQRTTFFLCLASLVARSTAFTAPSTTTTTRTSFRSTAPRATADDDGAEEYLVPGDRVVLIGPGFLQLNVAKAAKAAGLIPMVIAPQDKLDTFRKFVNDETVMKEADIGLPDPPGRVSGVVFCSEEAIFGKQLVSTVLDAGEDVYTSIKSPKRVVACAPATTGASSNKQRGMGWMPIFNNDNNRDTIWKEFVDAFRTHPVSGGSKGTLVRFGNLLGGSVDGPPELEKLGLDECIYKMSLENYRDLRERSFDRYRLGAQIIRGDATNPRPENLDLLEKDAIKKDELIEAYRITGGYPETDSACRHVVAQAIVQALMRPTRGEFTVDADSKSVPKEFTVLSKCDPSLPTVEQWDELFKTPDPASWPDPSKFDPSTLPLVES